MFNANKEDLESSEEQIAWDKKQRRYLIFAMSVTSVVLLSITAVVAWAMVKYAFPMFSVIGSDLPSGSAELQAAQDSARKAMNIVLLMFVVTLALYWPLRLFGRYLDYKVGPRPPKGGWKPYPYKPIDMTLNKVSDTERRAVVGKYEFKITTRLDRHLFGSDTLHVEISEVKDGSFNFVTGHLNLDVADFSDEWIANSISKLLEDHTDYFMEYTYSI